MEKFVPKILIVDDKYENLVTLRKVLSKFDAEIVEATNGNSALAATLNHQFALAILDVQMPDMDGYELAEILREEPDTKYLPIIFMSAAFSDDFHIFQGYQSGAVDFLTKPFNPDILNSKVKVFLQLAIQSEKINQANREIQAQNQQIQTTYNNIKELGEIGQEITSSLRLDQVLTTIYDKVNQLVDAKTLGVGIYDEDNQVIDYQLVIHGGKRYQPYQRTMQNQDQFPVWCIKNKEVVFINHLQEEYTNYINNYERLEVTLEDGSQIPTPSSLIYMPILHQDKVLGILTVQSTHTNAYKKRQLNLLRNLAVYIGIALENAKTYHNLQDAQTQLVNAEKMASLGQLTAGIAHEINNPINFVSANIDSLADNISDIMEVVNAYEHLTGENVENKIQEIAQLKEEVQYKEAIEELDELIEGIKEGSQRTAKIVRSLKLFSRLDEDVLKKANIHDNIDSTLVMLRNQYRDRVAIYKDYDELPEIDCYPGKLNQVFMNILSNGIQAIKDTGSIHINTVKQNNNEILITIKDSGKGMPPEIRDRIFEPFYTTKDVGKGTGLGLSISLGIIQKHQGNIRLESTIGEGTTFLITLPITIEA